MRHVLYSFQTVRASMRPMNVRLFAVLTLLLAPTFSYSETIWSTLDKETKIHTPSSFNSDQYFKLGNGLSGTFQNVSLWGRSNNSTGKTTLNFICYENSIYTQYCGEMGAVSSATSITTALAGVEQFFASSTDFTFQPEKFYALTWNRGNALTLQAFGTSSPDICRDDSVTGACNGTPYLVINAETAPPPCAVDCFSNVLFLPGIQSSRLYRPDYNGGTEKLWEPGSNSDVQDLFLTQDGSSVRSDVYANENDVLDEIPFTLSNVYKSFLADLDTWKSTNLIADYGVAAYDWRLSLEDILDYGNNVDGRLYYSGDLRATSTPYIIQELKRLAATSKSGKVTIIAHSNGGLVAKELLKRLEETNDPLLEKIDTVILVAVPQTGTPQALGGVLHGFDQGLPFDFLPIIVSPETARHFASTSPMAYHLIPSAAYISGQGDAVGTPVVSFDEGVLTQPFINAYGGAIENSTELHDFLLGNEGRSQPASDDLNNPVALFSSLLAYGESKHASLDSWEPPSTVQVHEIAGWGEDTLAGIRYSTGVECVNVSATYKCLEYQPKLLYSPETVIDGDGTVITPSALAMSDALPNVSRWWVNLKEFNDENIIGRNHASIFEIAGLRLLINNLISQQEAVTPQFISSSQPIVATSRELRFVLHSPLNLSVRDSSGNEVSASVSSFSGAVFKRFGEVQYISVPASVAPTLHLDGYAQGSFTLEVQEIEGNMLVASTTFAGIPTGTETEASMSFADGTITNATPLAIDQDGNGTVDVSLAPKLNGTIIPDTTPPTTAINLSGIPGSNGWYRSDVTVTLSAIDAESGVASTHFSLNGIATTGNSFILTEEGTHSLTFYSVDVAGNEEVATTTTIKIDKTAPEAVINSSISTKDLAILGVDNISSTTVLKAGNVATITDEAGNTTKLNFQRTLTKGFVTYARLVSIQYGTSTAKMLSSSFVYIWNTKANPPILTSQTVVVDKTFGVQALYDKAKNKTTIIVLKKNIPIQTTTVSGLAVIKLTTNKGVVGYSW